MPPANPDPSPKTETAHIGKSVVIKGELSGSEDLYVDGEVEGKIELHGHNLVIGPNGRVRAGVHARQIVIHGQVTGNVEGTERVELKSTASLTGDIVTQRIAVEEGAYFKGNIDIQTVVPATSAAVAGPGKPAPGAKDAQLELKTAPSAVGAAATTSESK